MRERDRELRRRQHRRTKVARLMRSLSRARTAEQRRAIIEKLSKLAPWRYHEFRRLLDEHPTST